MPEAMRFEKYRDHAKEWRWRLVAANGKTIADSGEGYEREVSCDDGIELVRTFAVSARIVTAP